MHVYAILIRVAFALDTSDDPHDCGGACSRRPALKRCSDEVQALQEHVSVSVCKRLQQSNLQVALDCLSVQDATVASVAIEADLAALTPGSA